VNPSLRVALVFPGQGAQYTGMGRDIYDAFPAARAVFDLADKVLGFAISRLCFEGPDDELRQTAVAQPAIVTFSLALLAAIRQSSWPITAEYTAGHSLGEYSALAAAGAVSFAEVIWLARRRGELMQRVVDKNSGAMSAVFGLDRSSLETICQETGVFIANYNSADQTVLSGHPSSVQAASALARERGARRVAPLRVGGAFHTPMMISAARSLATAIGQIKWADPSPPVIANTTGMPIFRISNVKKELARQLTHPVRWQESVETMIAMGINTFVEIGPGQVLTGLIRHSCPTTRALSLSKSATLSKYLTKGLAA